MSAPAEFTELAGELTRLWTPTPTGVFEASRAIEIIQEMEEVLRKQIAKDILSVYVDFSGTESYRQGVMDGLTRAARVAGGWKR